MEERCEVLLSVKWVSWGPFLIPIDLLSVLLLLFLGGKIVERWWVSEETSPKWADWLITAALLGVLVYRGSGWLSDPGLLLRDPEALLYLGGSSVGWVLSIAGSGWYLFFKTRKHGLSIRKSLDVMAVTGLIVGIGYSLLFRDEGQGGQPLHLYRLGWLMAIGAGSWMLRRQLKTGDWFSLIAATSGLGLLVISGWSQQGLPFAWGLTGGQWFAVLLFVVGVGTIRSRTEGSRHRNWGQRAARIAIAMALIGVVVHTQGDQMGEVQEEARPEIGWKAPVFAVQAYPSGEERRWSPDGTRPTVINFWASWCGPCRAEMPYFQEAYERYGDQVEFLMVNTRDEPLGMERYLRESAFTFPVWLDRDGAAASYQVIALPETYVVNTKGTIVETHVGAMSRERLFAITERLLATDE